MTNARECYRQALPTGISSHFAEPVNGLRMHYLAAGGDNKDRPTLLLLHGFPELGFSWRKVMLPLAEAGFRVIAPDHRGYGLTTGWDPNYEGDVGSYRMLNLVVDCLGLLKALAINEVHAVIGHDFGAPLAGYCALTRPDIFPRAVLMSAPFPGAPGLPSGQRGFHQLLDVGLAALERPRKHYQWYYSSKDANENMLHPPQGMQDFLRAYYYSKSAQEDGDLPAPLDDFSPEQIARMPDYYVMPRDQGMAETVAGYMPSARQIAACTWMTDTELGVYASCFSENGFQGALNWYRCITDPAQMADLSLFANRKISGPTSFIGGTADWGVYQTPGSLVRMETQHCANYVGTHFVPDAGHWLQQEQPAPVLAAVFNLLEQPI